MRSKTWWFGPATTGLAVLISLTLAFIIIILVSDHPGESILTLLTGPFSSVRSFGNVISMASTITFTGLAICVMFQASMFNLAPEGAFFFGGLLAAASVTMWDLPAGLSLLVPMLAGAAAGAVICLIPGVLKAKWQADELVSSLMLNYVMLYLGLYFLNRTFRDTAYGELATARLPENAQLSNIMAGTSVHSGVIISIVLIIMVYLFIYKTRTGYDLRIVGQNGSYARYSGIRVGRIIVISQLVGGAIAGLGGAVEIMGMYPRFQWTTLPGYGWDGVIVAILAGNKPQYVPIAALFLAYLRVGANVMARTGEVPAELITVIQAIMIILVTASALLDRYKKKALLKEVVEDGQHG